jgi:hypothetical protein
MAQNLLLAGSAKISSADEKDIQTPVLIVVRQPYATAQ